MPTSIYSSHHFIENWVSYALTVVFQMKCHYDTFGGLLSDSFKL